MSEEHEIVLVIKVTVTEPPDQVDVDRVTRFAAVYLNRGFGMDRLSIWHEGRRFLYDPVHDSDHYGANTPGRWVAPTTASSTNGTTPLTTP
jgi:hypothetical protein